MGLIYYTCKNPSVAVLVTSQVLIGLGSSVSVIASYIGVQGSVPHQDMAIATAVLNLWASLGSSISLAISATVWNKQVPAKLEQYLGDIYNSTELAGIFNSIYVARVTEPRELVKTGESFDCRRWNLELMPFWISSLPGGCRWTLAGRFGRIFRFDHRCFFRHRLLP